MWLPLGPCSTTLRTSWATVPFSGIFQGPRGAERHIIIFAQMVCPLADGSCFARLKNSHHGEVRSSATELQPFKGETCGQHAGGRGLVEGALRQSSVQTWACRPVLVAREPGPWNLEPAGTGRAGAEPGGVTVILAAGLLNNYYTPHAAFLLEAVTGQS